MEKEISQIFNDLNNKIITEKQAKGMVLDLFEKSKASKYLEKRRLAYGNTMKSIYNRDPESLKNGSYWINEKFLHEGFMLAVRRLKNNSM